MLLKIKSPFSLFLFVLRGIIRDEFLIRLAVVGKARLLDGNCVSRQRHAMKNIVRSGKRSRPVAYGRQKRFRELVLRVKVK